MKCNNNPSLIRQRGFADFNLISHLLPNLVGDGAGEFYHGAETELHDVYEVGLGQLEQRRPVDVVSAKFLRRGIE